MRDLIVVPFKPFSVAGNQYEEYWNAEHLHVYAMCPSVPLKDRIQIVQKRWRLKQDVAKGIANSNCSVALLKQLKDRVHDALHAASLLRVGKYDNPLDKKSVIRG